MTGTLPVPVPALALAMVVALGCGDAPELAASLESAVERTVRVEGVDVRYRQLGSGSRSLVFIHGWGGDHRVWRRQAADYAGVLPALYLDLPGHGASGAPPGDYDLDRLARGVEGVVRDAGVERAILVGHSNGVPVALRFERLFPQLVEALILVEGALRRVPAEPATIANLAARFEGPERAAAVAAVVPPGLPPEIDRQVRETLLATAGHVLASSLRGAFDPAAWDDDPIRPPMLVLLARSPFWDDEYEAYVRGRAPGVDYRVVDGVGHYLMLERPGVFQAAVDEFLSANGLLPVRAGRVAPGVGEEAP